MPIAVGSDLVTAIYLGTTPVSRAYLGADLVFATALRTPRGLTRPSASAEYPTITSAAPGIPSDFTILVEVVMGAEGAVLSWGRTTGNTRRISIVVDSGTMVAELRASSGDTSSIFTGPAVPASDGTNRWLAAIRYSGGDTIQQTRILPTLITTTDVHTAGSIAETAGAMQMRAWRRLSGTIANSYGSIEACCTSAVLTNTDLEAIDAAGSLEGWGAFDRGDLLWTLRPADGEIDGASVTSATQIEGGAATWALAGSSPPMTIGGID